ncbi:hypothetical protein OCGS_1007 [Oceaniovalibus guishaninsula JLT2003]|uniref:Uncharacterized protein n=1 Tax=Oceaniovalibus guishaninsula JLT2003 TaxID=1231392 RepID=K2HEK9_9RHOB|nr:hypothetical protein [Oceaniovalibus guishaninsula]EKE44972.1 hypothetical protein OCGS_1007 [Oceaniovalibus guishaninsula JLT2003]
MSDRRDPDDRDKTLQKPAGRDARLKLALKANMARRKAQANARKQKPARDEQR